MRIVFLQELPTVTIPIQRVPLMPGYGVAIELPKLQKCTAISTTATMLARNLAKAMFGAQTLAGCSYKGTGSTLPSMPLRLKPLKVFHGLLSHWLLVCALLPTVMA